VLWVTVSTLPSVSTDLIARLERHGMPILAGGNSVAITTESIEPAAEPGPRISAPGRHDVEIVGWHYLDHGDGQDVVFEVSDDEGRRQGVRFGLSDVELRSGQLTRFIAAVLRRQPPEPVGIQPHIVRQMLFNQAVGRRVALVVVETSPGDSGAA
jgi:hypothetical protein